MRSAARSCEHDVHDNGDDSSDCVQITQIKLGNRDAQRFSRS